MYKKSISKVLLFVFFLSLLVPQPIVSLSKSLSLSLDPYHWSGTGIIRKDYQHLSNGSFSLQWKPGSRGHYLKTKKIPVDWSVYNQLSLDIYSFQKTGAWINIILSDQNNHLSNTFMEIDWTGWKKVELSFNQLFSAFSSPNMDWKKISYLALESHPSALRNIDETELTIGQIIISQVQDNPKPAELLPKHTQESLVFTENVILSLQKAYEEKNDPLFSKAIEKLKEGKARCLESKNPTLEDIRDGLFISKLTKDEKLTQKCLVLLSSISKKFWDQQMNENELLIQNSFVSFALSVDLAAKDLAGKPLLQKKVEETIFYVATLESSVIRHWIQFYPFAMGNNHATRAACVLGIAAILYPGAERNQWFALSQNTLEHFFDFQITEDGVLNEGSHYYLFIMEILTYYNHFLVKSTQKNLFVHFPFSKKLSNMVSWSMQIRNPRGYLPSIDDSWQNMVNFPSRFLTPFLPNRESLCWNSLVNDSTQVLGESWNILKPFYLPLFLLSLSSYETPKEPNFATSSVFDGDSQIVFRDGWKKESNYAFLAGKKIGSLHEQDDTGNIQAESFQIPILLESGYGPLGWTSPQRDYYVSGQAHNVCLVDGQGPKSYYNGNLGPIDRSKITDYYSFGSFSYANMAISMDVLTKNLSYDRSLFFLPQKEEYPFYLLVMDHLSAKEPRWFQAVFHPNGSLESASAKKIRFKASPPKQSSVMIDIIALGEGTGKIQKGYYSEYWESEKSTQYVSFEQKAKEAYFATIILPSLQTQPISLQTDQMIKGSSREYQIRFESKDQVFYDYYNFNPYREIRQMKNLGTNAKISFVRKDGAEGSLETFFMQEGSFLNDKQKAIFFTSSPLNFIYLSKSRELYRYFCQYEAKVKSTRTFFKITDFETIYLDNQLIQFQRTGDGILLELPEGKHTLTFQ